MTQFLSIFFVASVLIGSCYGVSTKIDVFEDEKPATSKEDDVEVKHTIVVSTKLKNKGLHKADDPQPLYLSRGHKRDDEEIPIVKAYKSVDTTAIRTPDTRTKTPVPRTFNKHARDEYDLYPNTAFIQPNVWRPSSYHNNVNYWSQDDFYNIARSNRQDPVNINRRNEEARDFYCRKCRDLTKGCVQKSNSLFRESTTPKIKVDGKLAKLN